MTDRPGVRVLRPEDRVGWLRLWEGYAEGSVTEAVTAATWARLTDPAVAMHALLAERDGVPVGFTHLILHPNTAMLGPACFLQDLYVAPEARRAGIGRRLLEAAIAWADGMGAARVTWQTRPGNHAAQALYDSLARRTGLVQYRVVLRPEGA